MRNCFLLLLGCAMAHAQVNILTANGTSERTNANTQEYQLSPATVGPDSFGKLGTFPVDGQVYAQPLYASGIAVPGSGTRNVLYVATMHNTVYAFDAAFPPEDGPSPPLWQASLGPSVPVGFLYRGYSDIATEVGILGTGAIDLDRGVIYIVTASLSNGAPIFHLHALDLGSGKERLNGPVEIKASTGGVEFVAQQHIQRPGLLLANGAVYVAFGSHGDEAPWHGWIISYDGSDLTRQIGAYLSTPSGNGGAIWQSGRGIAADSQGALYAITGNGDYDASVNFSQSFLRFSGAAPVRTGMYTPPDWESMSDNDFDLSAGPALVPGTHILLGGDKGGNLYVIDGDSMDGAKGPACGAGSRYQVSPGSLFNLAVWEQPGGALIFTQGGKDALQSYRITGTTLDPSPVSTAIVGQRYSRIGMTLSADGRNLASGILWETDGDVNDNSAPGVLHAYQASNLANELWNSNIYLDRDAMGAVAKFASPTVADGRVFVSTMANRIDIYGITGGVTAPPPSPEAGGGQRRRYRVLYDGVPASIFWNM